MLGDRIGFAALTDKRAKRRAVVPIQPDLGANPQKTVVVLRNRQRTELGQAFAIGQAAEPRADTGITVRAARVDRTEVVTRDLPRVPQSLAQRGVGGLHV